MVAGVLFKLVGGVGWLCCLFPAAAASYRVYPLWNGQTWRRGMTGIMFATILALAPCKNIHAVKRIWDTNQFYIQYQPNGPWFQWSEKEFRGLSCEVKNYIMVG